MSTYTKFTATPTIDIDSGYYYRYPLPGENAAMKEQSTFIEDPELHTSNYTEYDLYCFKSKMDSMLMKYAPGCSCVLDRKRIDRVSKLYVRIDDGGDIYPITADMKRDVELMTEKARTDLVGYFVLSTFIGDLHYNDRSIALPWILSVLRYVRLPSSVAYRNIVRSVEYVVREGSVHVRVEEGTDPKEISKVLFIALVDELVRLNELGSIVLSVADDREFRTKWELERVYPTTCEDYALYYPTWNNFYLTKCPSRFLEEMYGGSSLRLTVGNDSLIRHACADALTGFKFQFCDKYVIVDVFNFQDANEVASRIVNANVIEGSAVTYEDKHSGLMRSVL